MAVTPDERDEQAAAAVTPQGRTATADELGWERRWARFAGGAALLSAVLSLVSVFIRASALKSSSGDANDVLETAHRHQSAVYLSAVTQAIASLLIAFVLVYLYRAARHRRPDTPAFTPLLAIVGAIAVAVMGFLAQHELVQAAKEFVTSKPPDLSKIDKITNPQAYANAVEALDPKQRAEDISNAKFGAGLQAAVIGANFILGIPFVLTGMWGRRAGVLSRFMGILGIIVGAFYCLPFFGTGGGGFIQIPWLGAVGMIFLDRWPGGRGQAWSTGEPVPWLSPGELRAIERGRQRKEAQPAPEPDAEPASAQPSATRSSRKRKRKRGRKH
jgi:Domain of unknown function (DUF4386)